MTIVALVLSNASIDADMTIEDIAELKTDVLDNSFVKIIIKNKQSPQLLDMFLEKLSNSGCADVKTIEDALNLENINEAELVDETKDTRDILHSYIDSVETNVDKDRIKSVIDELYAEALTL